MPDKNAREVVVGPLRCFRGRFQIDPEKSPQRPDLRVYRRNGLSFKSRSLRHFLAPGPDGLSMVCP